jgi:hypothetical protein
VLAPSWHCGSLHKESKTEAIVERCCGLEDWIKVFPDPPNAEVIARRLTERAETFIIDGKGCKPNRS